MDFFDEQRALVAKVEWTCEDLCTSVWSFVDTVTTNRGALSRSAPKMPRSLLVSLVESVDRECRNFGIKFRELATAVNNARCQGIREPKSMLDVHSIIPGVLSVLASVKTIVFLTNEEMSALPANLRDECLAREINGREMYLIERFYSRLAVADKQVLSEMTLTCVSSIDDTLRRLKELLDCLIKGQLHMKELLENNFPNTDHGDEPTDRELKRKVARCDSADRMTVFY